MLVLKKKWLTQGCTTAVMNILELIVASLGIGSSVQDDDPHSITSLSETVNTVLNLNANTNSAVCAYEETDV